MPSKMTTTPRRTRRRRRKSFVRRVAAALAAAALLAVACGCGTVRVAEGFSRPSIPSAHRRGLSSDAGKRIPDSLAAGGDAGVVAESHGPPARAALESFFSHLDELYNKSSSIRCPFFRRRAADAVDSAAMIARFLLIRHKSLGIFDPFFFLDEEEGGAPPLSLPPGCRAVGRHVATNDDGTVLKHRNLEVSEIANVVRKDWAEGTSGKGYYVTGKLNSTIYRDDCVFDGPDPDMPVRGLRKYLSAASHLFDPTKSRAVLLSLEFEANGGKYGFGSVTAKWKLGGVLMLPWRPVVKPWTGTTMYHLDEERLIRFHEEEWDISVAEAFVCTIWPEVGERIWGKGTDEGGVE